MSVIQVSNLSKRYRIGLKEKRHETLVGQIGSILRSPLDNFRKLRSLSRFDNDDESVFWALRDINFEVQQGDVLGIIGHNGAGKSTLLKILSRITEPSAGEVRIKGRISALLEVGTGFHPELTGRENIYMNGTILGMTRREITRKLDEIIDFSGVEKYVDTPVKFYSSGMKVRLGFAVAAHLEPEILIIDEVLAVGDAEFQRKCLGKMEDVAAHGRTVLFVSHNLSTVNSLCPKTILLNKGLISHIGKSEDSITEYFKLQNTQHQNNDVKINILYSDNIECWNINSDIIISISYPEKYEKYYVDLAFYNDSGERVFYIEGSKKDKSGKNLKLGSFSNIKLQNPGIANTNLIIDIGLKKEPNDSYAYIIKSAKILSTQEFIVSSMVNGKIIPKHQVS